MDERKGWLAPAWLLQASTKVLRWRLAQAVKRHGLRHPKTVRVSRKLDRLINSLQRRANYNEHRRKE